MLVLLVLLVLLVVLLLVLLLLLLLVLPPRYSACQLVLLLVGVVVIGVVVGGVGVRSLLRLRTSRLTRCCRF
jgi:hypothetical protein